MSQKRSFIQYVTTGKMRRLVNENSYPVKDLIHPLQYSPDPKNASRISLIPMNYKFQRKFYEQYKKLRK